MNRLVAALVFPVCLILVLGAQSAFAAAKEKLEFVYQEQADGWKLFAFGHALECEGRLTVSQKPGEPVEVQCKK